MTVTTLAPTMNPDVAWAVDDVRRRLDAYTLTKDYYEGNHRLVFATQKFRNAFGDLFREFADNMCDDVVDEPVNRMTFQGWTAKDQTLTQAAQDKWESVRGDARAASVHRDGWAQGDGFVLVWPDRDGKGRMYPQCPEQMAVRYDPDMPDEIQVAAKVWREGRRYRLNLYYAERIERYATKGTTAEGGLPAAKNFSPYTETRPDGTVQDWLETHSWGMPVHHFPADEVGRYGRSALKDVIPLQDALNKTVADMLVAMEFHALPQRWATGVQVEKDSQGNDLVPWKSGDERVWWTASEKAQFGQFAQADLGGFLDVQDAFRLEICRKGFLPSYMVNTRRNSTAGGAPSGVSLLIAEGRLVKRVKDAQRDWGPEWCAVMAQMLQMDGHAVSEGVDLDIAWAEPSTKDEKALLETLQIKVNDLGVTKRQALLEAGYDEDLIQDMEDERAANAPQIGGGGMPPGMGPGGRMTPPGGSSALAEALGMGPSGQGGPVPSLNGG